MTTGNSNVVYPLRAIRTLALFSQGLTEPQSKKKPANKNSLYMNIKRLGWIQIDTLQVIERAHYLTLWSRVGNYNKCLLDQLLYDGGSKSLNNNRQLFEYWMHAACIIPFEYYRLLIPFMRQRAQSSKRWRQDIKSNFQNTNYLASIMSHIESNGPSRPADFRTGKRPQGSWWNWDKAKIALEHLYNIGELAISNRIKFQRIYDLRERVLPSILDYSEPTRKEAIPMLLQIALKAMGICRPSQVGDYLHLKRTETMQYVKKLLSDGYFVQVLARLADNTIENLVVHRETVTQLEQAADRELSPNRTVFLNPFDNLFWAKGRSVDFWNFQQILESYKPSQMRKWGYYCLPILYQDKLVGRFDPKLERESGLLRIKRLCLEPDIVPTTRMISEIALTMKEFLRFHKAQNIVIEQSDYPRLGEKIISLM